MKRKIQYYKQNMKFINYLTIDSSFYKKWITLKQSPVFSVENSKLFYLFKDSKNIFISAFCVFGNSTLGRDKG